MGRKKKWVRREFRLDEQMNVDVMDDMDKGPDKNFNTLMRRLIRKNHEKNINKTRRT